MDTNSIRTHLADLYRSAHDSPAAPYLYRVQFHLRGAA